MVRPISHVKIQIVGRRDRHRFITNEAVDDFSSRRAVAADAVIKASDVTVAKD